MRTSRRSRRWSSKWGVSDDKLTYTFELRDGLKFSDGAAVTAADCVASVRRWAARSRLRPDDDGAREGHAGRRRQDLPHRAERTLWAGDREPVHDLDLALLHDAQEGRRDRPEPAGARDDRLRPVPLQSRRDAAGQPPRLRPQSELRSARRAALRHVRRQGGQARPRHLREYRRRADRAQRAAGRRDRFLRGAAAGPDRRSEEGQEPHRPGPEQDRPRRDHAAQPSASAVQQSGCAQARCSISSSRTT